MLKANALFVFSSFICFVLSFSSFYLLLYEVNSEGLHWVGLPDSVVETWWGEFTYLILPKAKHPSP